MDPLQTPMSDSQLRAWLPGTPIVLYSDFAAMTSLDHLLAPTNQFVFLYQWRARVGHWCCIWRRGGALHVFDPLGICVDKELAHVAPRRRHALNEDHPYLRRLLKASGLPVFFNSVPLQRKDDAVCGRECIVRLAFKSLGEAAYARMWGDVEPDGVVARVIQGLPISRRRA